MKGRAAIVIVLLGVLGAAGLRYWSSRSVEHAVLLDGGAQALAVDERTGRVFVVGGSVEPGKNTMEVSVLDAASGALLRTVQTPLRTSGARCCQPLNRGGRSRRRRVYVVSSGDDRLLLLDASSGEVRAVIRNAWVSALLPADPAGRMLAVMQGPSFGGVRVLDGRSGAILASFPCPDDSGLTFQNSGVAAYRPLRRLFVRSGAAGAGAGVCIIDPLDGRTLPRLRMGPNTWIIDSLAVDNAQHTYPRIARYDEHRAKQWGGDDAGCAHRAPVAQDAGRPIPVAPGDRLGTRLRPQQQRLPQS